ncbi:hypothetical protein ACIQM3_23825 [Streptomyces sp. NPDC091271]|uniref:hypothetical protein n=1 Tax=Streptomyces sp. NPDC091271 TaxID=3365980 RepID=UPI003822773D
MRSVLSVGNPALVNPVIEFVPGRMRRGTVEAVHEAEEELRVRDPADGRLPPLGRTGRQVGLLLLEEVGASAWTHIGVIPVLSEHEPHREVRGSSGQSVVTTRLLLESMSRRPNTGY